MCSRDRVACWGLLMPCAVTHAAAIAVAAGIDDPYEEPENAELVLEAIDKDGKHVTPQVSAGKILEYLHAKQLI